MRRAVFHPDAAAREPPAGLTMTSAPALQAENLHAGYGDGDVLRGISLEVSAGEMLAIVGPNGAGKSTLLRVLGGAMRPASGTVKLGGRPLDSFDRRELARSVAVVGQENSVAFRF